jgi:hypothetical protein
MTRHEQNELIFKSLELDLNDKPNIQVRLTHLFTKWFQTLATQGAELVMAAAQKPAAPAGGAEEGGAPAPEGGQA